MIPYEELCQALDRYNAKRRNEEELARLNHDAAEAGQSAAGEGEPAAVDALAVLHEQGALADRPTEDPALYGAETDLSKVDPALEPSVAPEGDAPEDPGGSDDDFPDH